MKPSQDGQASSKRQPRAAIYVRTAVDAPGEIEKQVAACRHCADDNGFAVFKTYIDCGASGGNMERAGLRRMLGDAGERGFEILLVTDQRRISRNLADFVQICDALNAAGAKIMTPKREQFWESPEQRLMTSILAARDELQDKEEEA